MNNIERAALLIDREYGPCNDDVNHRGQEPVYAAQALADAGLLLTDADRAVLDAAEVFEQGPSWGGNAIANREALRAAVRARREAQS